MVAMRERAELIGGTLEYQKPEAGGTRVRLSVAREQVKHMADKITVLLVDDHAPGAARISPHAGRRSRN